MRTARICLVALLAGGLLAGCTWFNGDDGNGDMANVGLPDEFEKDDDDVTVGRVRINNEYTRSIAPAGDTDYVYAVLSQGSYIFDLQSTTLPLTITIFRSNKADNYERVESAEVPIGSTMDWTVNVTQERPDIVVRIRGEEGQTGTYKFSIRKPAE
ncbi:MAG: hypothetical protein ACLFVU_13780 [Phycisphaerae bacterium]